MEIKEMLEIFKAESGARQVGICPSLPMQSGKAPTEKSSLYGMKSLLVGIFPYYTGNTPGDLCLYARGKDYHEALTARLSSAADALKKAFSGKRFLCGCDSSPVNEVSAALRAGLGLIGDNGLFLSEIYGSFVFIGTIATNIDFGFPDVPVRQCLHCGACKRACPTGILSNNADKQRECLSAITQKKGELTGQEKKLMKSTGMAWGCDACQLSCPYNRNARIDPMPEFREHLVYDLPRELLDADEKRTEEILCGRAFAWRGAEVLKRNIRILDE